MLNLKKSMITTLGMSSIPIGFIGGFGSRWIFHQVNPDAHVGLISTILGVSCFLVWFELTSQIDKKFKIGVFDHHTQTKIIKYNSPKESAEKK